MKRKILFITFVLMLLTSCNFMGNTDYSYLLYENNITDEEILSNFTGYYERDDVDHTSGIIGGWTRTTGEPYTRLTISLVYRKDGFVYVYERQEDGYMNFKRDNYKMRCSIAPSPKDYFVLTMGDTSYKLYVSPNYMALIKI